MSRQISDIRANIYYVKEGDKMVKFHEVILLIDSPTYKRINDGSIVKERSIEEVRINVGENSAKLLSKFFAELPEIKEDDLN